MLRPFSRFCVMIGAIPRSIIESLSYEKQLIMIIKWLREVVIPAIDGNTTAIKAIEEWIENVDLQEFVDTKLDEMAESGELEEIISVYLNSTALFGFDSVEDMKEATNLIDGSFARTIGYYSANDGGGALYKIRTVTNEDVEDNGFIIPLNNENLVAELIYVNEINILQFGCKGDGETDNAEILQHILDTVSDQTVILIPEGEFRSSTKLQTKCKVTLKGIGVNGYDTVPNSYLLFDGDGITGVTSYIECLNIVGSGVSNKYGLYGVSSFKVYKCMFSNWATAIYNCRTLVLDNCELFKNGTAIAGIIDSRITNNFIYDNTSNGIYLWEGANDNIIDSNKIEWNGNNGIIGYLAVNNIITNNIIDRSTNYGISFTSCSKSNITDNVLRRNYVAEGTGDAKSHVKLESCNNLNFSNNITVAGNSEDDGSGINVPATSLYVLASSNINLIGNNLKGCTNKEYGTYNNTGTITKVDISTNLGTEMTSSVSGTVSASGTQTFEIPMDSPIANGMPTYKRILILARTGNQESYAGLETYILAYKQWGTTDLAKALATTINSYLSISGVTFANSKATITITNTNTSQQWNIAIKILDI